MELDELLKESMDKLEKLPPKVAKHSKEIRELDVKCTEIQREIKIKLAAYVKQIKKLNKEQKSKCFKEVDALFKEAERLTQKKIKLAQALYDSVDADISTVDKANQALHTARPYEQATDSGNEPGPSDKRKKKKKLDKSKKGAPPSPMDEPYMAVSSVPLVEMPVDPNEPTYCICHQVSFGEMIMCDNPNCKTEWFHFQCVGLTESPSGKWYCDQCAPLMKKNNKKK